MLAQGYELQLHALSARDYELDFLDLRPDQGVSLAQLQQATLAVVQDVAQSGIPQASFDRVKARWLKRLEQQDRDESNFNLALEALIKRQPPLTHADYLAAARAITLDDLNLLTRAFAGPGRLVVDHISPNTDRSAKCIAASP